MFIYGPSKVHNINLDLLFEFITVTIPKEKVNPKATFTVGCLTFKIVFTTNMYVYHHY